MFPGAPAVPHQPHQAMLPAMRSGGRLAAVLRSAARQLSGLNVDAAAQPAARAVGAAGAAAVRCSAQSASASGSWGLGHSSAKLLSRPVSAAQTKRPARTAASAPGSQHSIRTNAAAGPKAVSHESSSNQSSVGDASSGDVIAQAEPAAPPAAKRKRGRPRKQANAAKPATDDTPAERDALSSAVSSGAAPETTAAAAPDAAADAGPAAPVQTGKTVRRRTKAASSAAAAQPQLSGGQASEALFAAQPPAAATKPAQPQMPLPDLDACVPLNPGPWAAVKRWVVFSDLHVAPRTAGVAVEVLRRVHAEAEARDAGVLFLGTF